ncbi:YgcG family protein [Methylomonas montana]|uniref:TPM domain-containing protein n=1 Tax=Methylomonas montana TaxID=3058963 RepID=UPI00265AAB34|nr:YgcG family protein [Methylomonas montana]WKJ88571.1 YgcG family protein [Methylomonas montana]
MRASAVLGRFAAFLLLMACLLATAASAEQAVPNLEHRVTDLTGVLTAAQQSALEQRLQAFEQQKGSQIAVLIVASTQPEDIAQYSIRVVEHWLLGRKGIDDGILILLAKDDRATRIEVGYGLEGVVPDVLAKRIVDDIMIPHFRRGDFAAGINAGVDSLIGLIQGEPLPTPKPSAIDGQLNQYFPYLFLLAMVGGGILRAILGRFLGGLVNGGVVGLLVWFLGGGLLFALGLALVAFIMTQSNGRGFGGRGGGFGGGGGYSSGGFSGGGGGFGGGGASGRW